MADMLRRARDRLSLKETSKSNPTGGDPGGAGAPGGGLLSRASARFGFSSAMIGSNARSPNASSSGRKSTKKASSSGADSASGVLASSSAAAPLSSAQRFLQEHHSNASVSSSAVYNSAGLVSTATVNALLTSTSTSAAAAAATTNDDDDANSDETSSKTHEPTPAEQRDAAVVEALEPAFFESELDELAVALTPLGDDFKESDIERAIDERETALHAVTNQLSRQVQGHRDEIVAGIDQVSTVEHDLNAGYTLVRNARRHLAVAQEEAAQSARVAEGAALKRRITAVLETLQQLSDACEMRDRLRAELEAHEYATAVRTCAICMEKLSNLGDKAGAAKDLKRTIDKLLDEVVQGIDAQVRAVCMSFDDERMATIVDAYVSLGDPSGLADKLGAAFGEAALTATTMVVKGYALAPSSRAGGHAASTGAAANWTYAELVERLPGEMYRSCLLKTLESLFDVLATHRAMVQWHEERMEEALKEESNSNASEVLRRNLEALAECQSAAWDLMSRRVATLLGAPAAHEGENFVHIVRSVDRFCACGEAFTGVEASALRNHMARQSSRFFSGYHRQNLEGLKKMLEHEMWMPLGAPASTNAPHLKRSFVRTGGGGGASSSKTPIDGGGDPAALFQRGNPFRADEDGKFLEEDQDQDQDSRAATAGDDSDDEHEAAMVAEAEDDEMGAGASRAGVAAPAADGGAVVTTGSLACLKWSVRYAELMPLLGPSASVTVFLGLCQLFEAYMLQLYRVFGPRDPLTGGFAGVSTGALTPRLQATLQRVTRSIGWAMPAPPPAPMPSPTSSSSDDGGSTGGAQTMAARAKQSMARAKQSMLARANGGAPSSAAGALGGGGGDAVASSETSSGMLSSGNLFALRERCAACESLQHLASEMRGVKDELKHALPPNYHQKVGEWYTRTLDSTDDLVECVFRAAAQLLWPVSALVEAIASSKYDADDIGTSHSAWVDEVRSEASRFASNLAIASMTPRDTDVLWASASQHVCRSVVEGWSRNKRVSQMGAAQMQLDLKEMAAAFKACGATGTPNLALAEEYVTVFYQPTEDELGRWMFTHVHMWSPKVLEAAVSQYGGAMGWNRKMVADWVERARAAVQASNASSNVM
ncbi:syndetin [Pycnococcus provasolii]